MKNISTNRTAHIMEKNNLVRALMKNCDFIEVYKEKRDLVIDLHSFLNSEDDKIFIEESSFSAYEGTEDFDFIITHPYLFKHDIKMADTFTQGFFSALRVVNLARAEMERQHLLGLM